MLAVADDDFLEVLDAPEIAVLTDRTKVEARDAERLRADLGVPTVEAPKVKVGRTVGETSRLDRIEIVDEEKEDVPVRRVERRRLPADRRRRIVNARVPVENARDLPARVADAVAGDPHDGLDQRVVVNTAIIGAGDGAKLCPSVFDLERLQPLCPTAREAVLQVARRQRRGKLAEIGRRRADEARELTEAPMRRMRRIGRAGQMQDKAGVILALGFDADRRDLYCPRAAFFRATSHRRMKVGKRKIPFVIGTREPLGGYAADALAARDVHFVPAYLRWLGCKTM